MRGKASIIAVAMGLGAVLRLGPVLAEEQPTWMPMLKVQLKDSQGCVLDKVLFVRDLHVGGDVGTEGRARCVDGREYDFTRRKEHQRFEIRLCQPTVC